MASSPYSGNHPAAAAREARLALAVRSVAGVRGEGDEPAVSMVGLWSDGAAGDGAAAFGADAFSPFLPSHLGAIAGLEVGLHSRRLLFVAFKARMA
jgi:hypothetical protein